jgi:hypothetical protein
MNANDLLSHWTAVVTAAARAFESRWTLLSLYRVDPGLHRRFVEQRDLFWESRLSERQDVLAFEQRRRWTGAMRMPPPWRGRMMVPRPTPLAPPPPLNNPGGSLSAAHLFADDHRGLGGAWTGAGCGNRGVVLLPSADGLLLGGQRVAGATRPTADSWEGRGCGRAVRARTCVLGVATSIAVGETRVAHSCDP